MSGRMKKRRKQWAQIREEERAFEEEQFRQRTIKALAKELAEIRARLDKLEEGMLKLDPCERASLPFGSSS